MSEKTPAQWTVEEVLPEDEQVSGCLNGVGRLVRLSPTGSYNPDEWWPETGQTLVVKPKEMK
jgi:hypothetical protein